MAVCYVVGAAPACAPFTPKAGDLVIAADGGQRHLSRMGIAPDLVVGDFDSSTAPMGVPFVRHPIEKDETDAALAIREGIKKGYRTFLLYGCLGGRLDHTLSAIQTALGAARSGFEVFLVGEGTVGTVLIDRAFTFVPHGRVSVFSLCDRSFGVTLSGLKYPLDDATLTNDYPLGVSNEGVGGTALVSVKNGALYLAWEAENFSL